MPFNAVTGKMEPDKAAPLPPGPKLPGAPAAQTAQAPAAPTSVFPSRPEHESTTVVESRVMSPESREARKNVLLKEGEVANARDRLTGVNVDLANIDAGAANELATTLERQRQDDANREAEDRKKRDQFIADQKSEIAGEVDAKRKAGAAKADFWKGNAAGEVFVAIMRGIQSGIQAFRGQSGPTDAERIVEAKMDAHERKLVGEWEARAENRRLKQQNFAEWEKARAQVAAQAAKDNEKEVGVITARAKAFAARLGGEKEQAMGELQQRLDELAARRGDQKYGESFDKQLRSSTTNRSPSGTGASRADDTAVFDPNTGAKLFDATTPAQAKELNDNGGKMAALRTDLTKYREVMAKLPKGRDPTGLLTSAEIDQIKSQADLLRESLIGQITQMNGAGAPNGTEKKDFIAALDRGNLQGVESHGKALKFAEERIESRWRNTLPSYGYKAQGLREQAAAAMGKTEPAAAAPAKPKDGEEITIDGKTYVVRGGKAVPK